MDKRYEAGMEELKEHLGDDAEKYIAKLEAISPFFARVNVEFAYGEIYKETDKVLDQVTQELITVSALTVLGYAIPQLKVHVDAALNRGASHAPVTKAEKYLHPTTDQERTAVSEPDR